MSLVPPQKELPFSPVPRATIQDHVYEKLRELIQNGGIEPGRTVTVQSLAEAFGVSSMPVREALHRLVAEKALTVIAGRSMGIPTLTLERLEDLRRVRVEIEGTAIRWATKLITAEDLSVLKGLVEEMESAGAANDRFRYVPANREFHFTIYRAAHSAVLTSVIESLWLQTGPYVNLLTQSNNWTASQLEHRAIHAALVLRDSDAAFRALQSDIDGAAKVLGKILSNARPQGKIRARRR